MGSQCHGHLRVFAASQTFFVGFQCLTGDGSGKTVSINGRKRSPGIVILHSGPKNVVVGNRYQTKANDTKRVVHSG